MNILVAVSIFVAALIIADAIQSLSTVIREFKNLIHRLFVKADKDASIELRYGDGSVHKIKLEE